MKTIQYNFVSRIWLNATIERIWDILIKAEAWPEWASGFKKIEILSEEKTLIPGRLLRCEVKGTLPYTLRFTLRITHLKQPYELEYESSGDLEGNGSWRLEPRNEGVQIDYIWNVHTNGPLFNFLGRFGWIKNAMIKNHDQVMEKARKNLENLLADQRDQ